MKILMRGLRLVTVLGLSAVLTPIAPAAASAAVAAPAQVTVVHGVRGLVADVRVDGRLVLNGFAPERITDPLTLTAGPHRVQIWPTGLAANAKPVLDKTIPVPAGARLTLGVGLDALGTPQITAFNDHLAQARTGTTMVAVRDIAAAPPVRVTLDSSELAAGLEAPQQKVASTAPGSHAITVLPTSGTSPLLPSQRVTALAGRTMVLYLIGSAKDNSLGWVTQSLRPAADTAPQTVQTGVGPPGHDGPGRGAIILAALAVLVVATACARVGRRRSWSLDPDDGVPPPRDHLTSRRAAAAVASALVLLCGCSSQGPVTVGDAGVSAATPSAAPPATGLLGSRPATLAAARAEAALRPVAVQVPGYPGFSPVQAVTTDPVTRGLDLPKNARTVAWWGSGSMPGEASGTAVLAAHVSFNGSRGPFTNLKSLRAGDIVRIRRGDGSVLAFRLIGRREVVKSALPRQDLFRTSGPPQLALVTCGGSFDAVTRNYSDNVIVYAVLVS